MLQSRHIPGKKKKKQKQTDKNWSESEQARLQELFKPRRAQSTDTHGLNQLVASQSSPPLWSNFTADYTHLASIFSVEVKVMVKSSIIALLKMSQNKRQFFSILKRIFFLSRKAFPVVWPATASPL